MAPEATEPPDADVHAAPELAVPLRAGPLRLVFDRGELRWIRLGEREVLRGIYVAVREEGWATVPAELEDLEIEAEPEAFRIRFRARHRRGGVRFDWVGRIQGGTDGRITYTMDGAAGSTFRRNRIGFCVLHPAEACAGRPCIVETVDGDRASSAFPSLVAAHQPFRNVRAILHEVTPGVEAEVRMEGETFETEDQRNWSDASFKTYGTPLHLPYPVEVAEGTRLAQSVTVRLFGVTSEPVQRGRRHRARRPPEEAQQHGAGDRARGEDGRLRAAGPRARRRRPRADRGGGRRAPAIDRARPRAGRPAPRRAGLGGRPRASDRRRSSARRAPRAGPLPAGRPEGGPAGPRGPRGGAAAARRLLAALRVRRDHRRRPRRPRAGGARRGLSRGPVRWRDGRALRRAEPAAALAPRARPARLRARSPGPRLRRGHDGREPRQPPLDGGHGAGASRAGSPSGSRPSRCARARTRARPPRATRGSRRSPTTRGRRRRSRRPGRSASSPPPPRPASTR